MATKRVVLSLITNDNDYQREQAVAAEDLAKRLNVELQIVYAQNDAILQSQQLLKIIQAPKREVDGIIVEPAGGTPMAQVAKAAAAAGIAWVLLNREADYIESLRTEYRVPVFTVSSDNEEIGRIQARQMAALLPRGGSVLYVHGPSTSSVAKLRAAGTQATLNSNIRLKVLRSATWTEAHAYQAIESWLKLQTSQSDPIDLVAGQNDYLAMGARKALQHLCTEEDWERWSKVPFLGIDGLANTGKAWVSRGLLAATIAVPPNTAHALDALVRALDTKRQPQASTLIAPASYPELTALTSVS